MGPGLREKVRPPKTSVRPPDGNRKIAGMGNLSLRPSERDLTLISCWDKVIYMRGDPAGLMTCKSKKKTVSCFSVTNSDAWLLAKKRENVLDHALFLNSESLV